MKNERQTEASLAPEDVRKILSICSPRGLLVGQITRVSQEGPGLFLNIDIHPATDFRKLEQVLILTRKPPQLAPDIKG